MSIYNYGFLQRNSRGDTDILWLSVSTEELRMAGVLAHALNDSVWFWHNPPRATQAILVSILNRLHRAVTELHMNSIDENHHTIHLVDLEMDRVMLIEDTFNGDYLTLMDDDIKTEFDVMRYVQRFLK